MVIILIFSFLGGSLLVTHHGRVEIVNAICRAAFMGYLPKAELSETLAQFHNDFVQGALVQANILWRAALNRAASLSERYTPECGLRSLDVLHVACALELKVRHFLTFDERQQTLSNAVGLRTIHL
jgi:hypothetical protein